MASPFLSRRELTELTGKVNRRSQMKWLTDNGFGFEIHEPTKHPLIKRSEVIYRNKFPPVTPVVLEPVYPVEPNWAALEEFNRKAREPWRKYPERWMALVYAGTKKNAVKREIPFDLSMEEYLALVEVANGHCMLSGIPFDMTFLGKGKRRPWAPSLDRIDSSKGYSVENCRLICIAANLAMNEWGEQVLRTLAHALASQEPHGRH